MKEVEVETYGKDMLPSPVKTLSLTGLRVFCEQEMYPKLFSGELKIVLINLKEDEDETISCRQLSSNERSSEGA